MEYTDEDIEFARRILTHREELTEEQVEAWMADRKHVELLGRLAEIHEDRSVDEEIHSEVDEKARLEQVVREQKSRRMTLRWSLAASVILIIGLSVSRTVSEWRDLKDEKVLAETTGMSSGMRAELILTGGKKVNLGQTNAWIKGVQEEGIYQDSLLGLNYTEARVSGETGASESVFNTLNVPAGGCYSLHLADGTRVLLNSGTELRYPVIFTGNQRTVDLVGEAYFEVKQDAEHPFVVVVSGVEVNVFGGKFNVNTLPPGTVQVVMVDGQGAILVESSGNDVPLNANQVAEYVLQTRVINVKDIDPRTSGIWKNKRAIFEKKSVGKE